MKGHNGYCSATFIGLALIMAGLCAGVLALTSQLLTQEHAKCGRGQTCSAEVCWIKPSGDTDLAACQYSYAVGSVGLVVVAATLLLILTTLADTFWLRQLYRFQTIWWIIAAIIVSATVNDTSSGTAYHLITERHVLAALCWFAVSGSFAQSLALFLDERMSQKQGSSGGGGGGNSPAVARGVPAMQQQQGGRPQQQARTSQQQGARVQQGALQRPLPPSAASSSNKVMAVPMQSKVLASGQQPHQQQLQQQQKQLPMSTATPPPAYHHTVYMGYPQQPTATPAPYYYGAYPGTGNAVPQSAVPVLQQDAGVGRYDQGSCPPPQYYSPEHWRQGGAQG